MLPTIASLTAEKEELLKKNKALENLNALQAEQLSSKDKEIGQLKASHADFLEQLAKLQQELSEQSAPNTVEVNPILHKTDDREVNPLEGSINIEIDPEESSKTIGEQLSSFSSMSDDECYNHLCDNSSKYDILKDQLSVLGDVVGEGGCNAMVFKATHQGKTVVVKKLPFDLTFREKCIEVELCMKLCHANIASADFFFTFQTDCQKTELTEVNIVMPFLDKGDLRHVFEKKKRSLSHEQTNKICFEVSKALEYLHSQQIVHRDVKPENIFLSSDNEVKLGDFGISTNFSAKRILTEQRMGTLPYMAPEICTKGSYHSWEVDIWALGVTFCELISKMDNAPFCFDDELSKIEKHKKIREFNYPRRRCLDIKSGSQCYVLTQEQDNIARKCLNKIILRRSSACEIKNMFLTLPMKNIF